MSAVPPFPLAGCPSQTAKSTCDKSTTLCPAARYASSEGSSKLSVSTVAALASKAWKFLRFSCRRKLVSYALQDRKSTRLNSSHSQISYAVFCLKKKKKKKNNN